MRNGCELGEKWQIRKSPTDIEKISWNVAYSTKRFLIEATKKNVLNTRSIDSNDPNSYVCPSEAVITFGAFIIISK